jgi:hypothetical protein
VLQKAQGLPLSQKPRAGKTRKPKFETVSIIAASCRKVNRLIFEQHTVLKRFWRMRDEPEATLRFKCRLACC